MDAVQTVFAIVLLFLISWKLALACVTVLPLYVLTFRLMNGRVRHASWRVQEQMGKISGSVQERLAGIALVKANAAEERERIRFREDTEEHYGRVIEQSNLAHIIGGVSEWLVHTGTVIVVCYGGYLTISGGLTAGDVCRFLGYLGIMYGPLRRFSDLNVVYQTSLSAVQRVFEVFDITPKILEKPHPVVEPPPRGQVVFEHVSFKYDQDNDETRACLETEGANGSKNGSRPAVSWATATWSSRTCPSPSIRVNGSRSSARPAPGNPPSSRCCRAFTTPAKAGSSSMESNSRTISCGACGKRLR